MKTNIIKLDIDLIQTIYLEMFADGTETPSDALRRLISTGSKPCISPTPPDEKTDSPFVCDYWQSKCNNVRIHDGVKFLIKYKGKNGEGFIDQGQWVIGKNGEGRFDSPSGAAEAFVVSVGGPPKKEGRSGTLYNFIQTKKSGQFVKLKKLIKEAEKSRKLKIINP